MGYVDAVVQSVQATAIRCGIHDKTLQSKKIGIEDDIKWLKELEREIAEREDSLTVAEISGIISFTSLMITDIIYDSIRAGNQLKPGPKADVLFSIIDKVRAHTRKEVYKRNKNANLIEKIDKISNEINKINKDKEIKIIVVIFTNLAKNSIALHGFIEDSKDSKNTINNSKMQLRDNLKRMTQQLEHLKQKIYDDQRTDDGSENAAIRSNISTPPSINFRRG